MIYVIGVTLIIGLFQPWTPWWWVMLVPGVAAFWRAASVRQAVGGGALAPAFVWGGYSAWLWLTDADLIARRMAEMLHLPNDGLLVLLTMAVGAICGAAGGYCGYQARAVFRR